MLQVAKKECMARGISITAKRVNVLSILLEQRKAISAYELVEHYEQTFNEPVPVITVYRVLDFFQDKNLVHKLETANKFVACTHSECHKDHPASQFLICKQCQKVEELSMSESKFEELRQTIEKAGFYLSNTQLEMKCICKACYAEAS